MQEERLKITGMSCGGCAAKVTNALKSVPGVAQVEVSLAAGEATVQYDEGLVSAEKLKLAVQGAGYGVKAADSAPTRPSKGCCG